MKQQYDVDVDRIVLFGFSMGGAGSWSIASHYPDIWAAVHAGAGFAETRLFYDDTLRPQDGPSGEYGEPSLPPPEGPIDGSIHVDVDIVPGYEKLLWGEGDATCYVRNLFNIPYVLAYSGENDRQLQASRIMQAAYAEEGRHLPHIIGPGMGHAYHPDTRDEVMRVRALPSRAVMRCLTPECVVDHGTPDSRLLPVPLYRTVSHRIVIAAAGGLCP